MKKITTNLVVMLFLIGMAASSQPSKAPDWRNIQNAEGVIPDENYCDQPYVVVAKNGDWVCVLTTGPGTESQKGQHVVASISRDKGRSWSPLIDIEPADLPASSWATPYVTPYGRIYVFYDFNGDNVTTLDGKELKHNSELGWYCYKYSDDNGRSWSQRYRLPMRKTTIDYCNPFHGDVQLFWGVSKPVDISGEMYFAFTKMAIHPQDMGEGFFYKSSNINTEKDPLKLKWTLLPEGDDGIFETTLGVTQEEHNIVSLRNNDIYCFMRTSEGYPAESYSRDGGHTWSTPVYARYEDGRVIKNPRACPRMFKCKNGNYLLWYHNNNIKGYKGHRNPVWVSGGVERSGKICWSQPEVLLYAESPKEMMSYPDMVELDGKYWITETQKEVARVHRVDGKLFESLWKQDISKEITRTGLLGEYKNLKPKQILDVSRLSDLENGSFSLEIVLETPVLQPGEILFDNRDSSGGFSISVSKKRTLQITLKDKDKESVWDTDPGMVKTGSSQHIVFIVDGAANLFTTVVNGKLCDGGRYRLQGWEWFHKEITKVNGNGKLTVAPSFSGKINKMRIYNRYLTTSEAIANYKGEMKK